MKLLKSWNKIRLLRVFLRQAEAINFWYLDNQAKAGEKFPTERVRLIHRNKIQKQRDTDQKMPTPWQCLGKLVTKPIKPIKVTK